MNTETEDRRSTQTPVKLDRQCTTRSPLNGERCILPDYHSGQCRNFGRIDSSIDRSDDSGPDPRWMSERTPIMDRHIDTSGDYNQAAQHAHIPASLCPVDDCKEWPTVAANSALPPACTPASPAINEFRIKELKEQLAFTEKEMDRLDSEATKYRVENVELRNRIFQFEQFTAQMAKYIDEHGPKLPATEQADGYRDAA